MRFLLAGACDGLGPSLAVHLLAVHRGLRAGTGLVTSMADIAGSLAGGRVVAAQVQHSMPGFGSKLVNTLPPERVARRVAELAQIPKAVRAVVPICAGLGRIVLVTGSLATGLWRIALRRTG